MKCSACRSKDAIATAARRKRKREEADDPTPQDAPGSRAPQSPERSGNNDDDLENDVASEESSSTNVSIKKSQSCVAVC
jgi:hypothetical protein